AGGFAPRAVRGEPDGERVDAAGRYVGAVGPHPDTESVRQSFYDLPSVGLRGVPDVGAQRDGAGVLVGRDNGFGLRLLSQRGRDTVGLPIVRRPTTGPPVEVLEAIGGPRGGGKP